MPGSSFNIACTNVMLNTAVADELMQFADELEKADNFEAALSKLIRRELAAHRRILFNGNGYSEEWPLEAARRGLLNLRSTPEALIHYTDEKNVALFARHGVYTRTEIQSAGYQHGGIRQDHPTSGADLIDMLGKLIVPACAAYSSSWRRAWPPRRASVWMHPRRPRRIRLLTERTAELIERTERLKAVVAAEPEALNARDV
ncbi:MAG: hypothetical protein ACLUI3_01670 [Christensenellales bacterium]